MIDGGPRVRRMMRAGDEDGLVRAYEPLLRSIVRDYFIPGAEPEDVLQHARTGALQAVRAYRGPVNDQLLGGFIRLTATRRVLEAVTHARRRKRVVLDDAARLDAAGRDSDSPLGELVRCPRPTPAEQVELGEALDELVRAAGRLSPTEWVAFLRVMIAGESYAALADVGLDAKAVDNALARARRKLVEGPRPARRDGVLLVDRALHETRPQAMREALRIHPGAEVLDIAPRKVRRGRVVAPQGRPTAGGSKGRPVWAVALRVAA